MSNILVTGASRGIGLEAALVLARAGHTVFATMRNPYGAPKLAMVAENESLPIIVSVMDVNDDASVKEAIGSIQSIYGPIDVLINNAGIEGHGSIEQTALADFRAIMETNYFGAIRCMHAVLPQMRERKSGTIINISSVAGKIACGPLGPYNASKFALEAVSEALAQEVKPFNIHVAIIEPGIIATDMARSITVISGDSLYPHERRFAGLFSAALENPVPASLIGDKILEILESGTWQLRHPVGPDAAPFLQWRASMTDEQWVDNGAASDEEWYGIMQKDFGMDVRLKEKAVF